MSTKAAPQNPTPEKVADPRHVAGAALVARQSIYDASKTVIAYELLYRQSAEHLSADVIDGRQATLQVITNAVLEIGLDRLAADLPVHINYPMELLIEPPLLPVPSRRVVMEILETVRGTEEVLRGIATLRSRGHRIALDDYSPRHSDPALLDLADMVKLDISQHSTDELIELVAALKRRNLTLVAERVETVDDFERCLALGFDAFQGYFLQHPKVFSARPVPPSRLGTLRLVALLQNEETSLNDVERLIAQDASLTYRLLRCITSSYYGFSRQINSIREAVVVLGFEKLRQLCALVALQALEDRPPTVFVEAMTRARMCEQLGRLRGVRDTALLFITGLFSTLDAMTGIPMPELLDELPLAKVVVRALIAQEGELGKVLREVTTYERGAWSEAVYEGLAPEVVQETYLEAVAWAEATQTLVGAQT